MKKILLINQLVLIICVVAFAKKTLAECDNYGGGYNSYYLTDETPTISFEFAPGCYGTHGIEVDAGFLTVHTSIYWWSNSYPSWHQFVDTWSSGRHDLYAGSSDVKFKVVFQKDLNKEGSYLVEWRYCMDCQ